MAEFKRGRSSTKDELRSGRPTDTLTPEAIEKVRKVVLKENQLTSRQIGERVKLRKAVVYRILSEQLHTKRIGDQWMQR